MFLDWKKKYEHSVSLKEKEEKEKKDVSDYCAVHPAFTRICYSCYQIIFKIHSQV